MAVSTTPRRALHDLPVNAHWIPSINLPTSSNNNMKRNIAEVEEPAASPVPSRLRLSEHTKPLQIKPSYPHFAPEMKMALEETCKEASQGTIAEGMQDGTVEESTQETTISPIEDSDSEGDTLNTQQTTATELSQATDTVQLSHAERLRLRLRIALFKVQTNQTNIPISQLCIPGHGSLGESVSQNDTPQPTLLPAPVLKSAVRPPQTIRQSGVLSSPPDPSETSPVKRSSPDRKSVV